MLYAETKKRVTMSTLNSTKASSSDMSTIFTTLTWYYTQKIFTEHRMLCKHCPTCNFQSQLKIHILPHVCTVSLRNTWYCLFYVTRHPLCGFTTYRTGDEICQKQNLQLYHCCYCLAQGKHWLVCCQIHSHSAIGQQHVE